MVYVDSAYLQFRGMKMCHMLADTQEELHAMADKIGLDRKWHQRGASTQHYDVCKSKRALAVKLGAKEIGRKELVALIRQFHEQKRDGVYSQESNGKDHSI